MFVQIVTGVIQKEFPLSTCIPNLQLLLFKLLFNHKHPLSYHTELLDNYTIMALVLVYHQLLPHAVDTWPL